jgi:hypothetical protein
MCFLEDYQPTCQKQGIATHFDQSVEGAESLGIAVRPPSSGFNKYSMNSLSNRLFNLSG